MKHMLYIDFCSEVSYAVLVKTSHHFHPNKALTFFGLNIYYDIASNLHGLKWIDLISFSFNWWWRWHNIKVNGLSYIIMRRSLVTWVYFRMHQQYVASICNAWSVSECMGGVASPLSQLWQSSQLCHNHDVAIFRWAINALGDWSQGKQYQIKAAWSMVKTFSWTF